VSKAGPPVGRTQRVPPRRRPGSAQP